MKKRIITKIAIIALFVIMFTALLCVSSSAAKVLPDGRVAIYTVDDLTLIRYNLGNSYVLMTDLVGLQSFLPIGTENAPFSGVFDGNGHTIKNISISSNINGYCGFFGKAKGAVIKNIRAENITPYGYEKTGALVGYAETTTVQNCSFRGTISKKNHDANYYYSECMQLGGLVGYATTSSTIRECTAYYATVSSNSFTASYAGGIVGYLTNGSLITDCSAINCSVTSLSTGYENTTAYGGGIVGYMQGSTMKNCYTNTSPYTACNGAIVNSGMLIGATGYYCTISNCFKAGYNVAIGTDAANSQNRGCTPINYTTDAKLDFKSIWDINTMTPKRSLTEASLHSHLLTTHYLIAATCKKTGEEYDICSLCGQKINVKVLPVVECSGEWAIIRPAAKNGNMGYAEKKCIHCGTVLDSREFTAEERVEFFSDVNTDAWYYKYVGNCVANGYMSGVSDTTFNPNGYMTRSMFVTILGSLEGIDKSQYKTVSFSDVKAGSWYAPYVEWAYKNGITSGYGGVFGVNDNLTREQMVTMLAEYAENKGVYVDHEEIFLNLYMDFRKVSKWAVDPMKWAIGEGYISGVSPLVLAPDGTSTRGMGAVIITNLTQSIGAPGE